MHQWTKIIGSANDDKGMRIAIDSNGYLYITGETKGTFNGGRSSIGDYDIFITKYSNDGNHQWTKIFGSNTEDWARGLAIDNEDNICVTGRTLGVFNGENNIGSEDIFIVKYAGNGDHQWTKVIGSTNVESGRGIAIDSNNNIYITGVTMGSLNGQNNNGGKDIFIIKYSSNGIHQWTKLIGSSLDDWGYAIKILDDSIFITGYTTGSFLSGDNNNGEEDVFIMKYTTDGIHHWTRIFGSVGNECGHGIMIDSTTRLYIIGRTDDSFNNGGTNNGLDDIFITKLFILTE